MTISLHLIHFPVYTLGPGTRIGVWFQGCSIRCPGCVTPESWAQDESGGIPVSEVVKKIKKYMRGVLPTDGLTISGGEPFDQPDALFELARAARRMGMDDILVYSGRELSALLGKYPEIPGLITALVDGRFEAGNETDDIWKGSGNQTLTVWDEKFEGVYGEWRSRSTRKLQSARRGKRGYLIGVPRQADVPRLKYP
ncbi:MAG: radical SAM protein [Synergistaceae bacterium]|nr:radical SAM protein [Synergistaceae bacterium]